LKIVHYVDEPDLAWGRPWLQLLTAIEALGHKNVLLCPAGGLLEETAREAGLACRGGKAVVPWLPFLCRRIGRVMRDERPQIIHTRLSTAAAVGGYWGRRLKIPVVSTIDKYPKARYYRLADRIIGCSRAVSGHMERSGLSSDKIVTIHNPVDTRVYRPDIAERQRFRGGRGLRDDTIVFLGLGRFVDWKAFDDLILACSRLDGHADWRLWLVGDGPERERLVRRVQETGLGSRAVFFGFARDVKPFLRAADLFIQPSREPEGFSLALLEAMAAGLPVIATDIGGTPDLVRPGVDGWLMRPGDVAGLGDTLKEVLAAGPAGLAAMSRSALSRAAEFDTARIALQSARLYEDIFASGKR
jgi:glycosyltransferase involved in cell wall biosynthesis